MHDVSEPWEGVTGKQWGRLVCAVGGGDCIWHPPVFPARPSIFRQLVLDKLHREENQIVMSGRRTQ